MSIIEILTAFLCAALSGMGVGGGGLLLIYIAMFTDTPQKEAQLYNLIFFMCASASALLLHVKKRRLDIRVISLLALSGVSGAIVGSVILRGLGNGAAGTILGGFLFLSGAASFFSREKQK